MSKGSFSTTPQERYLEDYVEGTVHVIGPVTITEDEIVQFGKRFDQQLFQDLRYLDISQSKTIYLNAV